MNDILAGKRIIFLGSSVTYGDEGYSFVEALADHDGVIPVKEAVNGTTLVTVDSASYIPRMETIDRSLRADAFVCQLSTNDVWRDYPLSDIGKAIEYIISYAENTWRCPVMFYTSPKTIGGRYNDMIGMLYEIAGRTGTAILDMNGDPEMSSITPEKRVKYMKDSAHPNRRGYTEWWLPVFEKALADLLSDNKDKADRQTRQGLCAD